MSLRQVTLGVVGGGKVSDNLVCDALNEHFAFGPEDAEGYFAKSPEFEVHLAFPVGPDRFTEGIRAVWQWAVRTETPFLAITDGREFEASQAIQETLLDTDDWQISRTPDTAVIDVLRRAPNPMLLVLTEDGQYTSFLREITAQALAGGIPAYDLSRALLEQGWQDIGIDPADVPQVRQEQSPAPDPVLIGYLLTDTEHTAVTVALADSYALITEFQQVARGVDALAPKLAEAERILRQLQPAAPAAPAATGGALTLVTEPAADAPDDEAPAQEPEAGSGVRMRTEIKDPETGQWRPAGRGRPKAGVETRRVPR